MRLGIVLYIVILCGFYPVSARAEKSPGRFYISKVNRVEKMWVLPPDRRNFLGSRGLDKFDYARPISEDERGEDYIVTWSYRGKQLTSPLILRFEYKLSVNTKEPHVAKYKYKNLKNGSYCWTFKNIGLSFKENGKVDRWKVSLVLYGKAVAEKRSFTWHSLEGT